MPKQSPELRQDLITGNWVLIAPGRLARSKDETKNHTERATTTPATCPFEILSAIEPAPTRIIGTPDNWRLIIIPNKYPALMENATCPVVLTDGLYKHMAAVGLHSVIITRDHITPLAALSPEAALEVFMTLQEEVHKIIDDPCARYISIFQNWGEGAGASQPHPHLQMLALSLIPPHIQRSLNGSGRYFAKTNRCVHCDILKEELMRNERVVYENDQAAVLAPYASSHAFELHIYPKQHEPHFKDASHKQLAGVTEALQTALTLLKTKLNDPDYNFFIHTSPFDDKARAHYHWHIEILPKTNTLAGFDLGTGIVINPVSPEQAAALLK